MYNFNPLHFNSPLSWSSFFSWQLWNLEFLKEKKILLITRKKIAFQSFKRLFQLTTKPLVLLRNSKQKMGEGLPRQPHSVKAFTVISVCAIQKKHRMQSGQLLQVFNASEVLTHLFFTRSLWALRCDAINTRLTCQRGNLLLFSYCRWSLCHHGGEKRVTLWTSCPVNIHTYGEF